MTTRGEPSEAERRSLLRSLDRVGPDKPIGYLPLYTVRDLAELDPVSVAADATARGLAAAEFCQEECCIKSGALYVYHREALACLLRSHADILAAAGMPADPDRFVAEIAAHWLDPTHPAYSVIAAAFGDSA